MTTIIHYEASIGAIKLRIEGDDAANYPKSYGAWNLKVWERDDTGGISHLVNRGAYIQATLYPNGVIGKVNETGLERLRKFVKHAVKLHGSVQFQRTVSYINDIELPDSIKGLGA